MERTAIWFTTLAMGVFLFINGSYAWNEAAPGGTMLLVVGAICGLTGLGQLLAGPRPASVKPAHHAARVAIGITLTTMGLCFIVLWSVAWDVAAPGGITFLVLGALCGPTGLALLRHRPRKNAEKSP